MASLLHNIRFALRTFRRHKSAYLLAIGVLAAGIAISTAVFSLFYSVLLRALPFPQQDSLLVVWKKDRTTGVPVVELAYPELGDLQSDVKAFSSVAVMPTTLYGYGKVLQMAAHEPVQIESAPVSHDFFKTLGVHPIIGRNFVRGDERKGAAPVVLLSYNTWQRHFSGDRKIIGRQINLSGTGYTVVGIMGEDVDFPRGAGMWTPLGLMINPNNRGASFLQAIARVRPGYSQKEATSEVRALFARLAHEYPEVYSPSQEAVITPLLDYSVGSARLQLLVSWAASLLLLLSSCATAGNLFLSKAFGRKQEIATRASLGASTSQIFFQFFTEALTATSVAGAAGIGVAWGIVEALKTFAPPDIPRLAEATPEGAVLLFAVSVSVMAALICSAAPTLLAARISLETALRDSSSRSSSTRRGRRLQNVFIVCQISITAVLLTASLLTVLSVRSLLRADIGFGHRNTVTVNLALKGPQYDAIHRKLFYTHLLDRLRQSPGVLDAGAVLVRPLEGSIGWDFHYLPEVDPVKKQQEWPVANFEVITPDYFRAVGTTLLEGRDFSPEDKDGAEPVVIVSRSIADHFRRLGSNPVGGRIRLGTDWFRIVGVVADTRYRGVTALTKDIYMPLLQSRNIPVNYLVVRGTAPAVELIRLVRQQVAELDPTQAIARIATIGELVDRDTARDKFNMLLLNTFGLGALLLAGAGIYAVVGESVAARTREIGIRMAVGADGKRILRELVSTTMWFVLAGELIGLCACLLLGQFVSPLLYAIKPENPVILTGVLSFLLITSFLAAVIPAWSATKVEPASILRS